MARVPAEVSKGDTVYCEDEAQDLYFSATVLEVDKCYSIPTASTLTLGDFKIEHDQTSTRIKQVADQLKTLEQTAHWYPWTRYADDDQGTGISSLPLGKAYMAVVWGKTATPSDNPADYAGKWVKVVGATGKDGADAVVLNVSSVNGNMFKNTGISTILTVSISVGGSILDTAEKMHAVFGTEAYLQWQVKNVGELEFTNVPLTDTRLSDEGFLFAVSAADVNNKSTFKCELYY
jgi:hypothetical protein